MKPTKKEDCYFNYKGKYREYCHSSKVDRTYCVKLCDYAECKTNENNVLKSNNIKLKQI